MAMETYSRSSLKSLFAIPIPFVIELSRVAPTN